MRNRSLPVVVGSVCAALALSACGGSPAADGAEAPETASETSGAGLEGMTLTVLSQWTPSSPQFAVQEAFIADLEAETGMKVELATAGDDLKKQFETATLGGKAPDVVITNLVEEATGWLGTGATVDVAPFMAEWGLADSLRADAVSEWADAEGRVQGLPYLGFVWPVWYNTSLLEAAGVTEIPSTTDDLLDAAAKLNAEGIAPFVVGGSDWSGNKLFLQIVQGRVQPEEMQRLLGEGGWCASADAMAGIEDFTALRDGGLFVQDVEGYTGDQMNSTFYEGGAAMMSAGSWAFPGVPDGLEVELGGFPIPNDGSAYVKPTAMQGNTASGVFISTSGASDNLDAVRAFVIKMFEPQVAAAMAEVGSYTTPVRSDEPIEFENALLAAAINDLPAKVDFAVMPDGFIPGASSEALIRQTASAYAPGVAPEAICMGLDSAY